MRWLAKQIVGILIGLAPAAPLWAGLSEGLSAYRRGDYAIAFREFRAAAEEGDAVAQFNLGEMYSRGESVPRDIQAAAYWYRRAAEQDHAEAAKSLGICLATGLGVPKDAKEASFWLRKSAELGSVDAQDYLGENYEKGQGVAKDAQQAVFWYGKAARQGSTHAQFRLGRMYLLGEGVTRDPKQGAVWIRMAAEQGLAEAQGLVGLQYLYGEGVPKDHQQAALWFRKSAVQGNAAAQAELGRLYASGEGVPKDYRQAVYWYRHAANQGDSRAQALLASMYDTGFGVAEDRQLAYFWALLASAKGFGPDASGSTSIVLVKFLDSLEAKLTAAQRDEVQAVARTWKPTASAPADDFPASRVPDSRSRAAQAPRETLKSTGTGFFVSGDRVVTNNHVTEGCTKLRVAGDSGGRLLSSDPRNDLALISSEGRSPDTATIRVGRVKLGEPATVAGFPLSGLLAGLNITTGNVSSLAGLRGDTRFLQITAPVQPGNSGGPLLDGSGKVIGVVVSKLDALKVAEATGDVPQNINFAINANVLASFLDANGIDYKSGPIGASITTQEVARRAQAFTVLIECWK